MDENIPLLDDSGVALELMKLPSSVMVGSAALGVQTKMSDIDICVLTSELEALPFTLSLVEITEEYDAESPIFRQSSLYRHGNIDIFMFTDRDMLFRMECVMRHLASYPKWLTSIKWFRVKMFRRLLNIQGY